MTFQQARNFGLALGVMDVGIGGQVFGFFIHSSNFGQFLHTPLYSQAVELMGFTKVQ